MRLSGPGTSHCEKATSSSSWVLSLSFPTSKEHLPILPSCLEGGIGVQAWGDGRDWGQRLESVTKTRTDSERSAQCKVLSRDHLTGKHFASPRGDPKCGNSHYPHFAHLETEVRSGKATRFRAPR